MLVEETLYNYKMPHFIRNHSKLNCPMLDWPTLDWPMLDCPLLDWPKLDCPTQDWPTLDCPTLDCATHLSEVHVLVGLIVRLILVLPLAKVCLQPERLKQSVQSISFYLYSLLFLYHYFQLHLHKFSPNCKQTGISANKCLTGLF